jgi:hypothetical protein
MLVVVGVVTIVGALVWTWITRQGRIDELVFQLHDADPRTRARAGVSIIEDGSRRAAKELQTSLTNEPDSRARLAIALAVARRAAQGTRGDFEQWAATELAGVSAAPAVRPPHAVVYAMADAVAPADTAIHWKPEPDA